MGEQEQRVLVVYAAGFPGYRSDEAEIRAAQYRQTHITFDPENPAQMWRPSTIDFRTESRRRGHAVAVQNLTQMLRAIRSYGRRRRIDRMLWFGHGVSNEMQFGGGSTFTRADMSRATSVARYFSEGARIILYACNLGRQPASAQTSQFLQQLADRLGVTVCGFRRRVPWSIRWNERRRITHRGYGRTWQRIGSTLPEPQVCRSPAGATGSPDSAS